MTEAGKYLLLDRVALGGMAEIYRAKSLGVEGFERIVVLKRILPQLAEDAEFVSMFVHEAKIAVQLSHANICPIYELGKIGATHFIAMEYVWGKDLREILRRFATIGQPMPPPMAAWIVSKILEALDYAHRKRDAEGRPLAIIHRDISPQNILVSYEGLVKIIDFGIAKAAGRATQTQAGVIKGKLAYMSPEQIMGRPIDHRSDIFATASVLHELLTGAKLFGGSNDIEIIDKVREARAPLPSSLAPHVPPELDAIVMRGLARDVNERYQTAGEMQEAIMYFIASMKPPYGTSALSRWMKAEFAHEIEAERAHLEKLSAVAQPGVPVASAPAPPPRAAAPVPDEFEEISQIVEEVSQLVRVEEIELSVAVDMPELDAIAPSRNPPDPLAQFEPEPATAREAPKAEAWHETSAADQPAPAESAAAVRHSLKKTVSFSAFVPPAGGAPPSVAPMPSQLQATVSFAGVDPRAISSAPPLAPTQPLPHAQPQQAVAPTQPLAQPPSPIPSQLQSTVAFAAFNPASLPSAMKPSAIVAPNVGAAVVSASQRPSAAPKKRRGWIYALLFMLVLLLAAGGGAAVWFFRFGGRAVLGI